MKFHISGRKTGKTSSIIDWLQEPPLDEKRIVVVHSEMARQDFLRRAWERGVAIAPEDVISFHHTEQLRGRSPGTKVAIDNLDLLLLHLFPLQVERVSATGELTNRYD